MTSKTERSDAQILAELWDYAQRSRALASFPRPDIDGLGPNPYFTFHSKQDGVEWFDDFIPNMLIDVYAGPTCDL